MSEHVNRIYPAKYCYEDNIIKKTRIDVETMAGINRALRVDHSISQFLPGAIP